MAEPVINVLGPVALRNRGTYAAGSTYEKLDVVTYQGSSYCAKTTTTGNTPTDTDYWYLLASKGDVGPAPVKGVDYFTADDIADLESTLAEDVTTEVSSQLSTLTSATPLAAASTDDFTDTTRIYVLTTDGHWYWYDGDSWEDGGVYQAAEDSDTVNKIQYNLLPVIHGNLFDKTAATVGKYLDGQDGHETTNATYSHSDYIEIMYNPNDLKFSGIALTGACYCYDSTKTIIENRQSIATYLSNGFPVGTKYIRYNFNTNKLNSCKLYNNSTEESYGFPYGKIVIDYSKIYDNNLSNPINIYVGSDKEYTKLNDAVAYANSHASKYTPVNIHLDNGTYNVLPASVLSAASSSFVGLELNDYVNIYGSSSEDTIIKGELPVDVSGYDFQRNKVSTINAYKNNIIKNCTITSKNMRYSLHNDDYKSQAVPNAVEIFENVNFITYAQDETMTDSISQVPVGIGAYNGRNTVFKNCVFKNLSQGRVGLLIHNNTSSPKQCYWKFENCDFISQKTYALNLSTAGSGLDEMVELYGCYLNKSLEFTKQDVYQGTEAEFIVRGYANSIPNIVWIDPLVQDSSKIRLI